MESERDLIIIGGGTAGLAAAQYAAEAGIDALLIEEMAPGGQALIISRLVNFPGIPERVSGIDFSMRLEKQTRKLGAEILTASVLDLIPEEGGFRLRTPKGEFRSRSLIMATGAKQKRLGVPGEEEFAGRGVSYCATCDGPFFKKKRILVVGGGDAACDEALFLAELSDKVKLIHRGAALEARETLRREVEKHPHIELMPDREVIEIFGEQKLKGAILRVGADGRTERIPGEGLFIFIGSSPRAELIPAEYRDEAGHIVTDERMASALPGLFAAGEVRNTPFKQMAVAAGEGVLAARSAQLYLEAGRSYAQ